MKTPLVLPVLLLLLASTEVGAQTIEFEKLYPVWESAGYSITDFEISDDGEGGYLVATCTFLFSPQENTDVALFRLDAQGDTLWRITLGGTSGDVIKAMTRTADGHFILAGAHWITPDWMSSASGSLIWLIKIDADGNIVWEKDIDPAWFYGWPTAVFEQNDGSIMVAGNAYMFWENVAFLAKFDESGHFKWLERFSNFSDFNHCSALRDGSGNYFLSGTRDNPNTGATQFGMVKADAYGSQLFSKTYITFPMFGVAAYPNLIPGPDGGFYLTGTDYDLNQGTLLGVVFRIGANGNQIWKKYFTAPTVQEGTIFTSIATSDGGVLCLTETNELVKFLSNGTQDFYLDLNPILPDSVRIFRLFRGSDGKLLLAGESNANAAYFLKLDGPTLTPVNDPASDNTLGVQASPNPTTGRTKLTGPDTWQFRSFQLTDLQGHVLQAGAMPPDHSWDLGEQTPGIYLLILTGDAGSLAVKLVKN